MSRVQSSADLDPQNAEKQHRCHRRLPLLSSTALRSSQRPPPGLTSSRRYSSTPRRRHRCWTRRLTVHPPPRRGHRCLLRAQLDDPRQSRGLISVSPSKGPVKSRLKAADAPTPCSAPPNAAPPAPAAKCIPARIVCPSPPWKRNSLALRNSSLSNGVSVPESSGQSRLHSSP